MIRLVTSIDPLSPKGASGPSTSEGLEPQPSDP
jgi:hypothetical protein